MTGGTTPQFEIPTDMRKVTSQSMEQARTAINGYLHFLQGHIPDNIMGGSELSNKILGYAERNVGSAFEFTQRLVQVSPYISHHLCMIGQICGEACWFFCRRGTPWRRQTREVFERYLAAKAAKGSRWASG